MMNMMDDICKKNVYLQYIFCYSLNKIA